MNLTEIITVARGDTPADLVLTNARIIDVFSGEIVPGSIAIKGGFIAGAGVILLLWAVMKVLGNIESSFNSIWQIKKSRVFVFGMYLG